MSDFLTIGFWEMRLQSSRYRVMSTMPGGRVVSSRSPRFCLVPSALARARGLLSPPPVFFLDRLAQKDAAGVDADNREAGHPVVALDDLQADAIQAAFDVSADHNGPCGHAFTLFQK